MPGIDDDARDELRLTLQVVPRWQLSDEGWGTVEQMLIAIRDAVVRDDRVSFYRHLAELDRAAPRRLARLAPDEAHGTTTAAPEPVLELMNSLVHAPAAGDPGTARP
ncbi:MAG: CATRA system-associated protein [Actinomycetota bacterium]